MAFEVGTKKEIKEFNWPNIVFYFSLVLLLISVLSYFVLTYLIENTRSEIEDLDKAINAQKTENNELIDYLEGEEEIINDFSKILNEHKFTNQIFDAVEEITHKEVILENFTFEPEKLLLSVSGTVSNFQALGEQLLIFQEEKEKDENSEEKKMVEWNLYVISYRENSIEFKLDLVLAPQIFVFKSQP